MSELAKIHGIGDQKAQISAFEEYLQSAIAAKDAGRLDALVKALMGEKTHIVVCRTVLSSFAKALADLPNSLHKQVGEAAIEDISSQLVSFEEPVSVIRFNLSKVYQFEDDYERAAVMLEGIPLDSGHRTLTNEYKVDIMVRIAQLWLEEEEPFKAQRHINKAVQLIRHVENKGILLRYKSCFASILDYNRKFLDAAARYYELSQMVGTKEEQEDALAYSGICAMLGEAGPQRARILGLLYKDERSAKLSIFPMLEKMFLDRIIRTQEKNEFAEELKEHQKAETGSGRTVLDESLIQHNMLAASKLYLNISFEELGTLLGITAIEAEQIAATMIIEGRMKGSIDQIDSMINFHSGTSTLTLWDEHIASACSTVNGIIDTIRGRYPQLSK